MNQREVVIVSGARTAIGDFGGSLKDFSPSDLGAMVAREALQRAQVSGDEVGQVVFGNVIHTEPVDMYISRVVALKSGVSEQSTALTVNRLCGSGLQAIVTAAQGILLGDADIAVAGGADCMSRAPYSSSAMRFGARMGDTGMVDMMVGALTDPMHKVHMGVTAENVRRTYNISREAQDQLAVESHRRAAQAIAEGRFKEQILPITLKTRRGEVVFDTDEHVRDNLTLEELAKLKPAFERNDGSVTAGNASSLNDGAAAVVLMERATAERRGLKPMARLLSYALAGVDPMHMGIGPVPASKLALERAGLGIEDLDVIEAIGAVLERGRQVGLCDVHAAGALTLGRVPRKPRGWAVALSVVLPGSGQIVEGATGRGLLFLLPWLLLLGALYLGWGRLLEIAGRRQPFSVGDWVAILGLGVTLLAVWGLAVVDLVQAPARALRARGDSQWRIAARHFRRSKLALAGVGVIFLLYAVAVLAPLLAPYDPIAQPLNLVASSYLAPFAGGHLLGTDQFGRDVLSRILYGARISLAIGFVATAISVTLGTMVGLRGLAVSISNSAPINALPDEFKWFSDAHIGIIPAPVLIMLVVYLLTAYLLHSTKAGRYCFAIGGNETAARLAGVSIDRYRTIFYAYSGLLAAVTGTILISYIDAAWYTNGDGFQFNSVAAAIIGGTSLTGGVGGIWGTLIGASILLVRGAIYVATGGTLTIQNCSFTNNTATDPGSGGGRVAGAVGADADAGQQRGAGGYLEGAVGTARAGARTFRPQPAGSTSPTT